jgi:deoxyribonuclease-4
MGLLGAHVSISGGIENAPTRGRELGCDVIQIFSKNQRQWHSKPLSEESINLFRNALQTSRIKVALIHDSYLINLGTSDPVMLKKSQEAFADEMIRAEQLNVSYLVFHPGTHKETTETEGIRRIAESLNNVFAKQPQGKVRLLLETTAGMGHTVGYRFEHLAEIISLVKNEDRMGVCFDTAHVFEAGYDFRKSVNYNKTIREFDRIVGLDRLYVFHLNDSKTDLGSRVDRHENIGEGFLGIEPFRFLMNDERFRNHPMILETPEGDDWYKKNLNLLRSL